MRMQNKWGIILLVLLPLLMCFSGCKEEREPELVMATDATFPPYEYFKGEEIVGVDVDVVAELARRNGMGARVENMKF